MPSASPPDGPPSRPSTGAEEGEVVEVFVGDSLEEAMAAAVTALGPDLEVRRARKVRAGVRGLLGRDRYEVLAVPGDGTGEPATPVSSDDALGDAFASLLDAADAHEARRLPPPAPPGRPAPPARPASRRPLRPLPDDDDVVPVRRLSRPLGRPLPPLPEPAEAATVPSEVVPPAPRSGSRRSLRSRRSEQAEVLPAEAPAPGRGRPARNAALSDRSPHPDPAVADHRATGAPLPAAHTADARRGGELAEAGLLDHAQPVDVQPDDVQPDDSLPPDVLPPDVLPEDPTPQGDAGPVTDTRDARPDDGDPDLLEAARDEARAARRRSSGRPATGAAARARSPRADVPADDAPAGRSVPRRWSRSALVAVGVPDAVLEHLPPAAPLDDLAWVVALTAAIEAVVPAPAEVDEAHPVVVNGHGLQGAVALLDAGCRGAFPGTITHAGRTAPATATELALVLRHHVNSGG